jgi:hypothetical protein
MVAEMEQPDYVIRPKGLGWEIGFRYELVTLTFSHVRGGDAMSAMVRVECYQPMLHGRPLLAYERLSLTDGPRQANLANRLNDRTGDVIEWRNVIGRACVAVLDKRLSGAYVTKIGRRPRPLGGRYLLQPYIERNQVHSIYGDGKVGKSWLGLACCVSVQSGLEVLPGFKPVEVGPCLYMDWETDADTMSERVEMICRGLGIDPVEINYLGRPEAMRPMVDMIEDALKVIQDEGVKLVVVDSVEMAMAGSRGEYGDQNDAILRLNEAVKMLGVTVILIDHISAEMAARRGVAGKAYGSIFKRNSARAMFEVKQAKESRGKDPLRHLAIYNTARNNGAELDPLGLAWDLNPEWSRWGSEDIDAPELIAGLPVWQQVKALLDRRGPMTMSSIVTDLGLNKGNVASALLRHSETFAKDDNGFWTVCTEGVQTDANHDANATEDPGELPF